MPVGRGDIPVPSWLPDARQGSKASPQSQRPLAAPRWPKMYQQPVGQPKGTARIFVLMRTDGEPIRALPGVRVTAERAEHAEKNSDDGTCSGTWQRNSARSACSAVDLPGDVDRNPIGANANGPRASPFAYRCSSCPKDAGLRRMTRRKNDARVSQWPLANSGVKLCWRARKHRLPILDASRPSAGRTIFRYPPVSA